MEEGICPTHGRVEVRVKIEGFRIFYVCPVCGDDLEEIGREEEGEGNGDPEEDC